MRTDTTPRFFFPRLSFIYRKNRDEPTPAYSTVTIAYTVEDGKVRYAASFCAPNDGFVKQRGRLQAAGRLRPSRVPRTPSRSSRELPFDTEAATPADAKALILMDLLEHLPSRWTNAVVVGTTA